MADDDASDSLELVEEADGMTIAVPTLAAERHVHGSTLAEPTTSGDPPLLDPSSGPGPVGNHPFQGTQQQVAEQRGPVHDLDNAEADMVSESSHGEDVFLG